MAATDVSLKVLYMLLGEAVLDQPPTDNMRQLGWPCGCVAQIEDRMPYATIHPCMKHGSMFAEVRARRYS